MLKITKYFAILVLVLQFLTFFVFSARAQDFSGSSWEGPYQLSSETGWADDGYIVADQYGFVHVFWTESNFPDNRSIIQYARYDGENWSLPIDIYISAPGSGIDSLSISIDRNNTLHLLFTEGGAYRDRPLFYTSAPAHNALSATNWSEPEQIDIRANDINIKVDSSGIIHILYTRYLPDPGVYHIRSEDNGRKWSSPRWLDPDIVAGFTPESLQFILDESDALHALWYYMPLDYVGGDWIRYSQSLDNGETWSQPFTIDKDYAQSNRLRLSTPRLAVQDQNVFVIWGGGDQIYRNFRFSTDGGRSWSLPLNKIFGDLNGQAGDSLAIDSSGSLHFFGQIRFPMAIYHSYWDQLRWTPPRLIYLIQNDPSSPMVGIEAHHLHSAMRVGNEIIITFTHSPGQTERNLFVMHLTLGDVLPEQVLPTPTPTMQPPPSLPQSTQTPAALPTMTLANQFTDPSDNLSSTNVLLPVLIPVLLMVLGVFLFQVLKRR